MKVQLKIVGAPTTGRAARATEPVAQEIGGTLSVQLPDGSTVKDIIEKASNLGVPKSHISMILLNGEDAEETASLHDGDAVTIIGEASGM